MSAKLERHARPTRRAGPAPPPLDVAPVCVNAVSVAPGFSEQRHRLHARIAAALAAGWHAWPAAAASAPPLLVHHYVSGRDHDGNDSDDADDDAASDDDDDSNDASTALDCARVVGGGPRRLLEGAMIAHGLARALARSHPGWRLCGTASLARRPTTQPQLYFFVFSWHANDDGWVAATLARALDTASTEVLLRDCFLAAVPVVRGEAATSSAAATLGGPSTAEPGAAPQQPDGPDAAWTEGAPRRRRGRRGGVGRR